MPIVQIGYFVSTKLDCLVIGGGTSGLVVATRLSEDPTVTVGVIEAGANHAGDPSVDIPGNMTKNARNPKYDWEFYTEPQVYAHNRKIQSSRGKGLGGSSGLNNLAFVRPVSEELDAFEKLGNPGWNWNNVLGFMKKSEHLCVPPLSEGEKKSYAVDPDPAYHGTDGPIAVSFPPYVSPIHNKILDSLETLGLPRNNEPNAGRNVGSYLVSTSVDPVTATRSYAASAYLHPHLTRNNLFVLTEAFATKIHFDGANNGLKRAVAVDFIKEGQSYQVKVAKEIILSAGTFQTPQILETSGIGDPRILEPLGIQCIIKLPGVGENLQDHMKAPTVVQVQQDLQTPELLRNPDELNIQQELYKEKKGILAGMLSSCFAFLPGNLIADSEHVKAWKNLANVESSAPEVFAKTHPDVLRGIKKQYKILEQWIDDPVHPLAQLLNINGHFPVVGLTPDNSKRYMTLIVAYTHPFSRGSVHITSADAQVRPAIQPNYLSNRADLEILSKAIEFTLQLYQTPPLSDLIVAPVAPPFFKSDDAEKVNEFAREILSTVHHPVGTASMMPQEDGGVVDHNLLVYGTSNLRVIDCSIIPLQISCNIVTLAYAIGEKASFRGRSV
uniref:Glucose-methanol-choline oxidoreductase N-terminal domain-containing protein n=1 Tax=Moniliophthora roreri TaxID=221103 RepID=A0A0W0G550_MONRR